MALRCSAQVIAKLCGAENKPEMKMRVEAEVANLGSRGIRSLAVARTAEGERACVQQKQLGLTVVLSV